jgi:hypothetical protein
LQGGVNVLGSCDLATGNMIMKAMPFDRKFILLGCDMMVSIAWQFQESYSIVFLLGNQLLLMLQSMGLSCIASTSSTYLMGRTAARLFNH